MKIICIEFENLKLFEKGKLHIDFFASDRVLKNGDMFKIADHIATQNIIGFIGLNATGKTSILRLLRMALDIVIRNADLNSIVPNNFIVDGTVVRTTFCTDGILYQIESVLGIREKEDNLTSRKFYYKEETLRQKVMPKSCSKSELLNFSKAEKENRSDIGNEAAKYLEESKSIIAPMTQGQKVYVSDNLIMNQVNLAFFWGKVPSAILEIFDDSIEEFSMSPALSPDKGNDWRLKFKNDKEVYGGDNPLEPNFLISSGTISGQNLLRDAILVLKTGGYLLVDELESHLNKEIIKVVLSLFSSHKTNPLGACIVFSTHYAEILDFSVLNRKDNIYITRKRNYLLSASKFSDEFPRNDFKKSEIILSNLLRGTAPRYEAIERLREYVCNQIR